MHVFLAPIAPPSVKSTGSAKTKERGEESLLPSALIGGGIAITGIIGGAVTYAIAAAKHKKQVKDAKNGLVTCDNPAFGIDLSAPGAEAVVTEAFQQQWNRFITLGYDMFGLSENKFKKKLIESTNALNDSYNYSKWSEYGGLDNRGGQGLCGREFNVWSSDNFGRGLGQTPNDHADTRSLVLNSLNAIFDPFLSALNARPPFKVRFIKPPAK